MGVKLGQELLFFFPAWQTPTYTSKPYSNIFPVRYHFPGTVFSPYSVLPLLFALPLLEILSYQDKSFLSVTGFCLLGYEVLSAQHPEWPGTAFGIQELLTKC